VDAYIKKIYNEMLYKNQESTITHSHTEDDGKTIVLCIYIKLWVDEYKRYYRSASQVFLRGQH
jgi:hypothetical protein